MQLCNGILCGLVAVTASCALIDPWAAIIVGALSSFVFVGTDMLMLKLQLDDVVAAVPMHMGCGILGMLFGAFFTKEQYANEIYGVSNSGGYASG
jgi:Amt family ammonium transporter